MRLVLISWIERQGVTYSADGVYDILDSGDGSEFPFILRWNLGSPGAPDWVRLGAYETEMMARTVAELVSVKCN